MRFAADPQSRKGHSRGMVNSRLRLARLVIPGRGADGGQTGLISWRRPRIKRNPNRIFADWESVTF
jgi:hypothetical protein